MYKNRMERRFSLNTTHINPIAESTCVNLNGTSSSMHFQWGGTPISPKNRSNSSICLSNNTTVGSHNESRPNVSKSSPQRAKANISKIDPRIYADVQSKGLASRIVKYHENGTRLNRSISANNLYIKPGQFPVVHLKKTELPYRATNQKLSMTHIAAPDKSMFYGNTLSSLLRSNSIVGLQKSDEELSHENRPILHPPPTESDLAPTRSVLDVLKEISRKRINSDDLDANDATKKYCNRDNVDAAQSWNHNAATSPSSAHIQTVGKRQREQFIVPNMHYGGTSSHQLHGASPTQSDRVPIAQHSPPEQVAKKRLCNYNNDIASSLSSSILHNNKRKLYAQRAAAAANDSNGSNSSGSNDSGSLTAADKGDLDYESSTTMTRKAKMQRQQQQHPTGVERFENLSKTLSCNTPITPIPATPQTNVPTLQAAGGYIKPVQPQRTRSEPNYPINNAPNSNLNGKPKLTLFNKNYEESSERIIFDERANESLTENGDEYAGIQFVKPKKSSSISNKKNPLIERTQKSKLALMLSGLRGELYHGDTDEQNEKLAKERTMSSTDVLDAHQEEPLTAVPPTTCVNNVMAAFTATMPASLSSQTSTTTATSTKASIIGINSLKAAPSTTTTTTTKITLEANVAISTASAAVTAQQSNIGKIIATSTATDVPQLGGFSFTPPPVSVSNTTVPASAAITTTKSTSPLVGLKLLPQANTASTTPAAAVAATPKFSFGAPPTTTVKTSTNATLPVLGGFSFGTTTPTANTCATSLAQPKTAVAPPIVDTPSITGFGNASTSSATTFTFGTITSTDTATAKIAPSPAISFGAIAAANVSKPAAIAATSPFAFGQPTVANSNPQQQVQQPAFGTASVTNSNPQQVQQPAFGTASVATNINMFAAPTPTTSTGFSFGTSPATAPKSAVTVAPFSFSGAKQADISTVPPTVAPSSQQNNAFAFGSTKSAVTVSGVSANTQQNNAFGFGGAASSATIGINNSATSSAFGAGSVKQNNMLANNSNSFNFGASNSAANTAAPPSYFSSVATAPNTTNATENNFQFSGTALPPQNNAFGNNSSTPAVTAFTFGGATVDKPTTTAGGFSFETAASVPSTAAATTNIFGAPATGGGLKASFNFGTTAAANLTKDITKSLFGGAAATSAPNNTFGMLSSAANATAASTLQNNTFNFGSNNSNNSGTTAPVSNLFGVGSPANNKPVATGGFAFGAGTNSSNNQKPTATATPIAAAFSFGSNNSTAINNQPQQSAAFTFGSPIAAPKTSEQKSFAFGGGATVANTTNSNTPSPNLFGAPNTVAPPPAANIFAAPPSGGDRPIRRATRRLQK